MDERISKKPRRDENIRRVRNEGRLQSKIFSVVRPNLSQSKSRSFHEERSDAYKEKESDSGAQKNNLNSVVRVTSRYTSLMLKFYDF